MTFGLKDAPPRVACAFFAISLCITCSCGPEDDTAQVEFVLVAAGERQGGMNPRNILDRSMVVEATCQVFIPNSSHMYHATFPVNPQATEPEDGRLIDIPAGSGYYARILGLTAERSVFQCGANGPFILEPGEKEFVIIMIDRPPAGNDYCSDVCDSHDDCGPGLACPSPCAAGDFSQPCTPALCSPG